LWLDGPGVFSRLWADLLKLRLSLAGNSFRSFRSSDAVAISKGQFHLSILENEEITVGMVFEADVRGGLASRLARPLGAAILAESTVRKVFRCMKIHKNTCRRLSVHLLRAPRGLHD